MIQHGHINDQIIDAMLQNEAFVAGHGSTYRKALESKGMLGQEAHRDGVHFGGALQDRHMPGPWDQVEL